MASTRKKNILLFILLLLITGASVGYYFYNKGPVNIKNASAKKITAPGLYRAFLSDSLAARKNYSGNILIVSGTIASITENQRGQTIILLNTGPGLGFINCTMEEKTGTGIVLNRQANIKGFCSGLGEGDAELGLQPDLYLERCILQP